MIILKDKAITRDGQMEGIKKFEVWFLGVNGLCTTLEEALADAEKNDYPPSMLRAVPVAIGVHGHYEVFMQ